jgi:hypothetical protein
MTDSLLMYAIFALDAYNEDPPLCLTCLIWRYTTIAIKFEHDPAANAYQFNGIIVLHGDLKYDPDPIRERNVSTRCPAFPVSNRK